MAVWDSECLPLALPNGAELSIFVWAVRAPKELALAVTDSVGRTHMRVRVRRLAVAPEQQRMRPHTPETGQSGAEQWRNSAARHYLLGVEPTLNRSTTHIKSPQSNS